MAGGLMLPSCATTSSAGPAMPAAPELPGALTVKGTRLLKGGKPFFISGINYWAGPTLARDGNQAGWDQVRRDLDGIQAAGLNMIRTCVATEGPDTEPFRIVPTIQPAMGQYDPAGIGGVMRFSEELQKRGLYAIYMLNNFWQWSGGFAQYLSWAGAGAIPYPPPAPNGNWDRFQHFSGGFYTNAEGGRGVRRLHQLPGAEAGGQPDDHLGAGQRAARHEQRGRVPQVDRRDRAPDQVAGAVAAGDDRQRRADAVAALRRPRTSSTITRARRSTSSASTCGPPTGTGSARRTWPGATPRRSSARRSTSTSTPSRAAKVGKPILLEEFGFPRDGGSFDPASTVTLRDQYFQEVYALVHALMPTTPMAGIMPWAWAGDSRPTHPGEFWKPGDPFIGDPPHEEQGWYSVFDKDTTLKLITEWSPRITGTSVTS